MHKHSISRLAFLSMTILLSFLFKMCNTGICYGTGREPGGKWLISQRGTHLSSDAAPSQGSEHRKFNNVSMLLQAILPRQPISSESFSSLTFLTAFLSLTFLPSPPQLWIKPLYSMSLCSHVNLPTTLSDIITCLIFCACTISLDITFSRYPYCR